MSIVEKIQNLPENTVTQDDNFIMLSEALSEYHRLIQEAIMLQTDDLMILTKTLCMAALTVKLPGG